MKMWSCSTLPIHPTLPPYPSTLPYLSTEGFEEYGGGEDEAFAGLEDLSASAQTGEGSMRRNSWRKSILIDKLC
jgi:hypothetical protein